MHVPHNALVLVADSGRFCLYRNTGEGHAVDLELLAEEQHQVARTGTLGEAPPGRNFSSTSPRRSSYDARDLHEAAEEAFAASAAKTLRRYMNELESDIIVVSDPRTLGHMRKNYDEWTLAHILAEVRRDYAARSPSDVIALLSATPS